MELLTVSDLPRGFSYPTSFVRVVELGLIDIEPWRILGGDELRGLMYGLAERYPERELVPFARRQDNDDVACWAESTSGVVVIHDFASPGSEQRENYENFHGWLRRAIEDLIEWQDLDEWDGS